MGLKNLFWLGLLALFVSSSFLFTKIAVQEIPPFTLAILRTSIATIILYVILRIQGYRFLPFIGLWKQIVIIAFYASLVMLLLTWRMQHTDSAIAAILQGTIPLFTIVLAHFFTTDERLTLIKISGIFIGFT
jgi:drug/metabolite transporter (DMT)-like permease